MHCSSTHSSLQPSPLTKPPSSQLSPSSISRLPHTGQPGDSRVHFQDRCRNHGTIDRGRLEGIAIVEGVFAADRRNGCAGVDHHTLAKPDFIDAVAVVVADVSLGHEANSASVKADTAVKAADADIHIHLAIKGQGIVDAEHYSPARAVDCRCACIDSTYEKHGAIRSQPHRPPAERATEYIDNASFINLQAAQRVQVDEPAPALVPLGLRLDLAVQVDRPVGRDEDIGPAPIPGSIRYLPAA